MESDKIYEYILVRFGELSTKGKNRREFIKQLTKNTKVTLEQFTKLQYQADRDRLYIYLNGEDYKQIEPLLAKVFGIRSFSPAIKCPSDIEEIKKACLEAAKNEYDAGLKTFKVVARRNDKNFGYISDEINRLVAGEVLRNTELKVDVHNPDFKLIVEVHQQYTYIMSHTVIGAGGYPVFVGGKSLLMLSGGIDSPVAGYEMMKRGVAIECIHYASMPYTSKQALDKVIELATLLSPYQGNIKVHIIPFTKIQLEIHKNCPESYNITIMRRMMFRIAQMVAEKRNCLALVTGESVGQVASQTLESISVINNVVNIPVIRPVATFDKLEIIELAKKLNTYETSILPYEDCCTIFTPKNPVTKPKLQEAIDFENRFDFEPLLQEAVSNMETVIVPKREE